MKLMTIVPLFAGLLVTIFSHADNREGGGRLGATAVYLNLTSYGTGIDHASLAVHIGSIEKTEAAENVVHKVVKQQGREGETLLCVEFADAGLRVEFVREIAPLILKDRAETPRNRTSVKVGFDCSDYEKATEHEV